MPDLAHYGRPGDVAALLAIYWDLGCSGNNAMRFQWFDCFVRSSHLSVGGMRYYKADSLPAPVGFQVRVCF